MPNPGLSQDQVDKIVELSAQGKRHAEVAEVVGCSASTVSYNLKRLGKPTRSSTPKGKGLSRESFREKFDQDTRLREAIRRGVATLTNDEEILRESDFRSDRCESVPTAGFRQVAAEDEFRKYRFTTGSDEFHWTTPATKQWALKNVSKARDV